MPNPSQTCNYKSELDRAIGQRLQIAREHRGYRSARVFAAALDTPISTHSQRETGKRSLNPSVMLKYCEFLQISPNWLLTGEGDIDADFSGMSPETEIALNFSNRQTDQIQAKSNSTIALNTEQFKNGLKRILAETYGVDLSTEQLDKVLAPCITS